MSAIHAQRTARGAASLWPIAGAPWALAFALALTLAAPPAAAQGDTPEARRAEALALVQAMDSLMGPERMLSAMKTAMQAPLQQQLNSAAHLTPAQRERAASVLVGEMSSTLSELMKDVMPATYAAMADAYVARFSLAEIQDVRRFYESSAGRKSVTVMVDDMPRLTQPMMDGLQHQMPRLQQRIEAAVAQLRREGIQLQPPPTKAQL